MMHHSLCRLLAAATLLILLLYLFPLSGALADETGVVNAKVVLRKSASQDSQTLQTLPEGEEVSVLSLDGGWYRVRYGIFTGYIMKKFVSVSVNSQIASQDKIDALGSPPGALYIGDEGPDVKKLQDALKILGYYTLRSDGIYGNGTTTAVALYQQDKGLEADGIAGLYTIRSLFGSCAKSVDITVSGRDSGEQEDTDSSSSNKAVSTKNVVSSFSEIGSVPGASREGDSGSDVVKLQQALCLLGYYTAEIDGDYGEATKDAVTRFQTNRGMNADGIAGASTVRVLFSGTDVSASSSSANSKYETQVLDWFKDKVNSVIPRNAEFIIKDVRTGRKFSAVRWSGVYHLDAEPASSEDTEVVKSICGGIWSWSRRPILILYNGKVYAASMNCMPHGTSTIDNDFDGHFCIHFKNSKTHETCVVDQAHQEAVAVAANAVW
ncbi:MAG: peptidoglycan-binding protein [Clostridiales bacterium]|nr:peptidoglycan-binding protein [Clostridiales bacterium]